MKSLSYTFLCYSMYMKLTIMHIILTFLLTPGTMSQDNSVNSSAIKEYATVENKCSGKDPLISISIALWLGVIASVFFLYLYWKHVNLKPNVYVSHLHNSEMEEDLHSEKTTVHTVKKEPRQSKTEHYESLTNRNQDTYGSLDTKQEESIPGNEDSTGAKDF